MAGKPPNSRRFAGLLAVALALAAGAPRASVAEPAQAARDTGIERICDLIATHADEHSLPRPFLARLIWKESRFNPNAVSPKGAEGIAQFMPGTADMRGLRDAFDIEQAIPASAAYLGELTRRFGNLGLAAAAYNAGEGRIGRWLSSGGFLPLETENYVLDILGAPADHFIERDRTIEVPPLDDTKPFLPACQALPVSGTATVAMASRPVLPWGIQVAGSFNREAAIRQWQSMRTRHSELLSGHEPVVSRVRTARGRAGLHAVRIGAASRAEADGLCDRLRRASLACMVMRNQ